ncbi:hypothetical protein NL676_016694 [Syzygium grande]|nr:hypothetical protein NL676_016694 [Syzygium grande]
MQLQDRRRFEILSQANNLGFATPVQVLIGMHGKVFCPEGLASGVTALGVYLETRWIADMKSWQRRR